MSIKYQFSVITPTCTFPSTKLWSNIYFKLKYKVYTSSPQLITIISDSHGCKWSTNGRYALLHHDGVLVALVSDSKPLAPALLSWSTNSCHYTWPPAWPLWLALQAAWFLLYLKKIVASSCSLIILDFLWYSTTFAINIDQCLMQIDTLLMHVGHVELWWSKTCMLCLGQVAAVILRFATRWRQLLTSAD